MKRKITSVVLLLLLVSSLLSCGNDENRVRFTLGAKQQEVENTLQQNGIDYMDVNSDLFLLTYQNDDYIIGFDFHDYDINRIYHRKHYVPSCGDFYKVKEFATIFDLTMVAGIPSRQTAISDLVLIYETRENLHVYVYFRFGSDLIYHVSYFRIRDDL